MTVAPRRLIIFLSLVLVALAALPMPPVSTARAADEPSPAAGGGELPEQKVLFLTFDDGPSTYTAQILDILAEYDAKATFFVIGRQASEDPDTIAALYEAGHGLGNHSWSHFSLVGVARWAFDAELEDTGDLLGEKNGWCLRPPYGAMDDTVVARAAELGYETVKWTIDPQDWRQIGSGAIANHVISHAVHNGIVLLHDGGGDRSQTVAALPIILRRLSAEGWQFKALCRDVRPSDLTPPEEAELLGAPLSDKPEAEGMPTPYSEAYPDGAPLPAVTEAPVPSPAAPAAGQRAPRSAKPGHAAAPTPAATPTPLPSSTPDLRSSPRRTFTPVPAATPTATAAQATSTSTAAAITATVEATVEAVVEATPAAVPDVAIVFPAAGATVRGVLLVQGVAAHRSFVGWRLDLIAAGEDPRFLALGETPLVRTGPLVTWDTRSLPNGEYTLRLRMRLDGGDVIESAITVTIDNP